MEPPPEGTTWEYVDIAYPERCDGTWSAEPATRLQLDTASDANIATITVLESIEHWVPDPACRLALRSDDDHTVEAAWRGAVARFRVLDTGFTAWRDASAFAWLSMPQLEMTAWDGWRVAADGWVRTPVVAVALRRPMTEAELAARDACASHEDEETIRLVLKAWAADRRASPAPAQAQMQRLVDRLDADSALRERIQDLVAGHGPAEAAGRLGPAVEALQSCPDFPVLTLLTGWLAARAELPELMPERAVRALMRDLSQDDAAVVEYLLAESTGDPDATGQAADVLLRVDGPHQILGALHMAAAQREGQGSPSATRQILEPWADDALFGARVHFELGSLAELRGDADQAAASYSEALARDASFAEAANALGFLAVDASRWADARRWFDRALSIQPDLSEAANNLGFVLEHGFDDQNGALEAYQRAVRSDPQNAAAWMNLGQLLEARGAPVSESSQAYERALAVNPGDDMARRAIQGLRSRPPATILGLSGTWESADPSAAASCLWSFLANGDASLACHAPGRPSLVLQARWVVQEVRASQMRLLLLTEDLEVQVLLDVLDEDRIVIFSDASEGPFPLLLRRREGDTSI